MRLYEIANDYLALMQAIENDEIPEDCIADTLESITSILEDKADNIACLIKNLVAEAEAIKAEETRLAERRKSKEKTAERMKEYLSETLLRSGYDKIETARNKISFRKSEVVSVADEAGFIAWASQNRDDLLTFKEPTLNKTAIKKAIASGEELIGATIEARQNIQIK